MPYILSHMVPLLTNNVGGSLVRLRECGSSEAKVSDLAHERDGATERVSASMKGGGRYGA
jgi:hypothetical protein